MTKSVQSGLTIGDANDPARLIERRKRLRQSVERAEGERKIALQSEIDAITVRLDALKAALEE